MGKKLTFGSTKKGLKGPYMIKCEASKLLTIDPPKTDQLYGTHKVIVLPQNGNNQVFYKYEPYAPGI